MSGDVLRVEEGSLDRPDRMEAAGGLAPRITKENGDERESTN